MKRFSLPIIALCGLLLFAHGYPGCEIAKAASNASNVTTAVSPVSEYGQVVVDNTATLIVAAGARHSVTIRNVGAVDVYIGFSSGVTTANGFLLQASGKESITLDRTTSAIYGICAASNTTVGYLKE